VGSRRAAREYAFVIEREIGGGEVAVIEVKGEQRVDVVAETAIA